MMIMMMMMDAAAADVNIRKKIEKTTTEQLKDKTKYINLEI